MDVSYQYMTFFMEDDDRLAEIKKVCCQHSLYVLMYVVIVGI